MKKTLLTIALAGLLPAFLMAQFPNQTIGLRFNSGLSIVPGGGAEISYQKALSGTNRLEADLGWRLSHWSNVVKLTGAYHWVYALEDNFNWYIGPAAGIGLAGYRSGWKHYHDFPQVGLFASVGGQLGLEYNFDEIPLQLSLDLRPQLYLSRSFYSNFDADLGFSIRYILGR